MTYLGALQPKTITPDDLAMPWKRLVANILDGLILAVPSFIALGLWFYLAGDNSAANLLLVSAPFLIVAFIYQVWPTAVFGQTLGKHIMQIRIVSAQDLGRPGWWRAVRRWGLYAVFSLIPILGGLISLIIWIVGGVMVLTRADRKAVHDLVADTMVVNDGVHSWS
jgi:uncharacterized RDD family membrane protein YckC